MNRKRLLTVIVLTLAIAILLLVDQHPNHAASVSHEDAHGATGHETSPSRLDKFIHPDDTGKPSPVKKSKKKNPDFFSRWFDKNGSGKKVSPCVEVEHGEDGLPAKQMVDYDCDGRDDVCEYFTYDLENNIVHSKSDDGCNGRIDSCHNRRKDEYGNVTYTHMDKDCDGEVSEGETIVCFDHSNFDNNGKPLNVQWDHKCDGKPELCNEITYDSEGKEIQRKSDHRCDGTIDSCDNTFYDGEGRSIASATDSGCDASIDFCTFTTYNEDGEETFEMFKGDCSDRLKQLTALPQ